MKHSKSDRLADTLASKRAHSIAIPLDFEGPQPNHFGVERASRAVFEADGFCGDIRRGGSCNVDRLSLIPHCQGTHTESVSHIVEELVPVGEVAPLGLCKAALVTVEPVTASDCDEEYRPSPQTDDHLITASSLQRAMEALPTRQAGIASNSSGASQATRGRQESPGFDALIIRTLPNDPAKRFRAYGPQDPPPFLSCTAMDYVLALEVDHLLVDIPSVDRMHDEGLLTNHHRFWGVPEGAHRLAEGSFPHKTITEMIYVPDQLFDGWYGLILQVPSFVTDAAPSRPVLFESENP